MQNQTTFMVDHLEVLKDYKNSEIGFRDYWTAVYDGGGHQIIQTLKGFKVFSALFSSLIHTVFLSLLKLHTRANSVQNYQFRTCTEYNVHIK